MNDTTFSMVAFHKQNENEFCLGNVDNVLKQKVWQRCLEHFGDTTAEELYDNLACIKILSRDSELRKCMTNEVFLSQLLVYAFPTKCYDVTSDNANEALKTLSNLIFKESTARGILISMGIVRKIVGVLESFNESYPPENTLLLCLKLLFLLSGLDDSIRHELAESEHFLQLFLKLLITDDLSQREEVVCESLKIIYNILYAWKDDEDIKNVDDIRGLAVILRNFLSHVSKDLEELPLIHQIVNILNALPNKYYKHLLYETANSQSSSISSQSNQNSRVCDEMCALSTLIDFLDIQLDHVSQSNVASNTNSHLEERLCPILNCLIRACRSDRRIRKYCRMKVLPYLGSEVKSLPEEGSTRRNRLCRLLTNPVHNVSELVALFLFVICNENIDRAIKYTGFGNFAGFLARHALLAQPNRKQKTSSEAATDTVLSEEYLETSSDSETEEYSKLRENVNPVTGRWERPQPNPMDGMTEEQKEYLAMELLQKIDQLDRSGLVRPGTIGEDGRIRPVEHVLELLQQEAQETNATTIN